MNGAPKLYGAAAVARELIGEGMTDASGFPDFEPESGHGSPSAKLVGGVASDAREPNASAPARHRHRGPTQPPRVSSPGTRANDEHAREMSAPC